MMGEALQLARCALARVDLWEFCKLMAPDFYTEGRPYLRTLCRRIQGFLEGEGQVLVVNLPPRHGKSRTAGLAVQWLLGRNPGEKIMTGSYNETLSTTFSKAVRNAILEEKADPGRVVYGDVFPGVSIKRGDGAANLWSLEGQHASYLATSPTGTATGFGCTVMIVDDLIKSAYEANHAATREAHWSWFTDTMLSRLEAGGKILLIMTRWHSEDLAGRAIRHFTESGWRMETLVERALGEDGAMLCDQVFDRRRYEDLSRLLSPEILSANYQQLPIDLTGRLYNTFKTYRTAPAFVKVWNYTDTADEGRDYLCSICFGETREHEAYLLEVLYTKAPMEETEPAVARMLAGAGVAHARIESNNGGKGFARSVQRILRERGHRGCVIKWFHQGRNKQARILTGATWVMEHCHYPEDWQTRWPDFCQALHKYQREGQNDHDDAPDALTGVAETLQGVGGR